MKPQRSDALTLEETLDAMRRIGEAHPEYIEGYRSAFLGEPYDFGRGIAYARGRSAGLDAWGRGAHGSDAFSGVSYGSARTDGAA